MSLTLTNVRKALTRVLRPGGPYTVMPAWPASSPPQLVSAMVSSMPAEVRGSGVSTLACVAGLQAVPSAAMPQPCGQAAGQAGQQLQA